MRKRELDGLAHSPLALLVVVCRLCKLPGPFTHRVLLTLEEKKVPYDIKYIDTSNKPDWFLDINPEGKVPCAKFDEEWIADSDRICEILEEKFPEKSLETPESAVGVGGKVEREREIVCMFFLLRF